MNDIVEIHRQKCHPDVWSADAAELDAAGWGEVKDRTVIPPNWREFGPKIKKAAQAQKYREKRAKNRKKENKKWNESYRAKTGAMPRIFSIIKRRDA